MRIQNNIMAMNAHRSLGINNNSTAKSLEKLSSGFKINRAGDDAAGLAISEKMRAQIKGLETAQANANDGISLIQTAEGALTEVHSMLNRMTELATKSANGTMQDAVDREALQSELKSLSSEIDRIAQGTNFNGINLLDGSMGTGTTGAEAINTTAAGIAAGAVEFTLSGVDEGVSVKFATVASTGTTSVSAAWGTNATGKAELTLTIDAAAGEVITQAMIDDKIRNSSKPDAASNVQVTLAKDIAVAADTTLQANLITATAEEAVKATAKSAAADVVGGGTTDITLTSSKAGFDERNLTIAAAGAIGATVEGNGGDISLNLDAAKEYTASEVNAMLSEAGANMTISFEGKITGTELADHDMQLGNGAGATVGKGLASGGGLELQVGDTADSYQKVAVKVDNMGVDGLGLSGIDLSTQSGAADALKTIKNAINTVSTNRANLGALQNRLEHTVNNLSVTTENMTAAESRIRDVDMAKEMMNFTKNNILSQAAQAMLAQANQQPQGVLQLLR